MMFLLDDVTLSAIQAEATRAHIVHEDSSMYNAVGESQRLAILTEEVGEVAKEINEIRIEMQNSSAPDFEGYKERIVKELSQVAAMARKTICAVIS